MSQIPIAYIAIRVFAHATEDLAKVVKAVHGVLPTDQTEIQFSKSNLTGHYGNPIILIEAKIRNKQAIVALIEKLASHLSPIDKEILRRDIHFHVEKGNLYIRLHKQLAFQGKVTLGRSDPIRMHIRFKTKELEDVITACRDLGVLA